MNNPRYQTLSRRLAGLYSQFPQVEAVAMAGSLTSGTITDPTSDIDLYVYTHTLIPLSARLALVKSAGGASQADMDLDYWDLGDEWFDRDTGFEIDVMYWEPRWIEEMLDRILVKHQASLGYSTSHWHTIRSSHILFDRAGWMERLLSFSQQPYPDPLRQAIIDRNHAVLRDLIPAYLHQIEKAVQRGDWVSVNHRVAALLASYFDIIFAVNRVPNPGEKRLLEQSTRLCKDLPDSMIDQVTSVLQSAGSPGGMVVNHITRLLDTLDQWLAHAR